MKQYSQYTSKHPGVIALITVLVMGAILLALGSAVLWQSLLNQNNSRDNLDADLAYGYANTCIETALFKLSMNSSYTGSETLTFSEGTCTINQITATGQNTRTVIVVASVRGYTKRIQVQVADVNPPLHIQSWKQL